MIFLHSMLLVFITIFIFEDFYSFSIHTWILIQIVRKHLFVTSKIQLQPWFHGFQSRKIHFMLKRIEEEIISRTQRNNVIHFIVSQLQAQAIFRPWSEKFLKPFLFKQLGHNFIFMDTIIGLEHLSEHQRSTNI